MACALGRGVGWLFLAAAVAGLCPRAVAAQTIAAQDFNALSSSATATNDMLASGAALTNGGSFNGGGPGLDFQSYWFQTRSNTNGPRVPSGQPGAETSGDFIGVNGAAVNGLPSSSPSGAPVGAAGDHNYEFNDCDGRIEIEFEPVDVSGYEDRAISLFYWVGTGDNYEGGDRFTVRVTDGTNTVTAVDQNAAALQANRGVWIAVSIDVDHLIQNLGFGELLTLVITGDTDGANENLAVDDILFSAGGGGATARTIPEIQGAGASSPHLGELVETTGVVTGDFQLASELGGFFIGAESGDGDPLTSDGLFVAASDALADVAVGDRVTVVGTVGEPANLTTLVASSVAIDAGGAGLAPVFVAMPEASDGDLERREGMLVALDDMTVAQTFFLGRYGQLTLSSADDDGVQGRLFQPTQLFDASSPSAAALADENQRRLLVLDDGQDVLPLGDNPSPVPYIGAPPPAVIRSGDRVTGLVGVLDQGSINSAGALDYRLHPTVAPGFVAQNERDVAPTYNGLSVVSLNVLNYFTTLGSRGARNATELSRQRDKLVATIQQLDADLYGLIEIENNAAAMQDLLAALNAATPGKYASAGPTTVGSDQIKVTFLYTPATLATVGVHAVLDDAVDSRAITTRNRPAIAQTFQFGTERFTAIVNHWKSKGSACTTATAGTNEIPDPDLGDGQGNCNLTRTSMAEAMVDWLAGDPTASGDPDFLIVGDLNAYANEDPPQVLKDAGYVDLVSLRIGPGAYSYVFDGQSGYLDHAFASPSLAAKVNFVAEWHGNADEPKVLDYDTQFNPPGYYAPDAYRASDHDPLHVGIQASPPGVAVPLLGGRAAEALAAVSLLLLGAAFIRRR